MLNGIVDGVRFFSLAMERDILMTRACNGAMETSFDYGLREWDVYE